MPHRGRHFARFALNNPASGAAHWASHGRAQPGRGSVESLEQPVGVSRLLRQRPRHQRRPAR